MNHLDNSMEKFDIIVIGAGLVGLSTGYHLQQQYPDKSILIIAKERSEALHQSSHNSGVIHSGVYYRPGSLKAKNCISGYQRLLEFAEKYQVPYDVCGKLIVATSRPEIEILHRIYERGVQNGLKGLEKLGPEGIRDVEPHVVGEMAIWVPQAGIIDFPAVASRLKDLFLDQGGIIRFNEEVVALKESHQGVMVNTHTSSFTGNTLISCAGLYSDRVTRFSYAANDLRIVPFKGCYYQLKPQSEDLIRNLVYPVPDPNFPFLGVHFTRMISGGIEAGPNAVLTLKREGYTPQRFSLKDTVDIATWPGFWKIARKYGRTGIGEIYRTLSKRAFTRALQKLVPSITMDDIEPGRAGVRAQACNRAGVLLDDFDFQRTGHTFHVRNAPSPAATSCLAIGNAIADGVNDMIR